MICAVVASMLLSASPLEYAAPRQEDVYGFNISEFADGVAFDRSDSLMFLRRVFDGLRRQRVWVWWVPLKSLDDENPGRPLASVVYFKLTF